MNNKREQVARILSSHVVRTGWGSLRHLWQERFGRKLESHREILDWLCSEGYQRHEAEDMTLEEVAELLRSDEIDELVTLEQVAKLKVLERSVRTLENHSRDPLKRMPNPEVQGGGRGKKSKWSWNKLRPWLEETFDCELPRRFPKNL